VEHNIKKQNLDEMTQHSTAHINKCKN